MLAVSVMISKKKIATCGNKQETEYDYCNMDLVTVVHDVVRV
jgi:hypothetical protein